MKNTLNKGFTLIELLVVVAIIGVLATIVLSSLGEARSRAKDASLRAGLKSFQTQAEIEYDGDYDNVCDPTSNSGQMYRDLLLKSNFGNVQQACHDQNQHYFTPSAGSTSLSVGNSTGPDANGSYYSAFLRTFNETWICVDSNGSFIEYAAGTSVSTNPTPSSSDRTC